MRPKSHALQKKETTEGSVSGKGKNFFFYIPISWLINVVVLIVYSETQLEGLFNLSMFSFVVLAIVSLWAILWRIMQWTSKGEG